MFAFEDARNKFAIAEKPYLCYKFFLSLYCYELRTNFQLGRTWTFKKIYQPQIAEAEIHKVAWLILF